MKSDKFQKIWEQQHKPIHIAAPRIKKAKNKEAALRRVFKGIFSYPQRKALFESRKKEWR